MGCKSSKAAPPPGAALKPAKPEQNNSQPAVVRGTTTGISVLSSKPERLYKFLAKAQTTTELHERENLLHKALDLCRDDANVAAYQNPTTLSTPLHMAIRLLDSDTGKTETLYQVIRTLLKMNREALSKKDSGGNIPLHYAIAPSTHFHPTDVNQHGQETAPPVPVEKLHHWKSRAVILGHIIEADLATSRQYLSQNDIEYESGDSTGACSPLYRVLQTIPDDFDHVGPTVEYVAVIQMAYPKMAGVGNSSDGDKPLSLLYRRFTRQFDISEKFFAGDNSRPEVVNHRRIYKAAAGNTWRIIELLLRPDNQDAQWGIVHRAVQVETPPDLLRYIVETNAQDLTRVDKEGNLPLHHAAKSKPPPRLVRNEADGTSTEDKHKQFPAFYTKYVVDELLYKFPEGASMPDSDGNFSLTLAIQSGKQWIGGGIKSLYDAYPDALNQIDLQEHQTLKRALSMDERENTQNGNSPKSPEDTDGIIKDEHHDAIMLVQQPNVDISEVVTSMWAHEEDAGVQMLGCVAIGRMAEKTKTDEDILRISLSAVAAVVNAMKAHPNEMIVQEKACKALKHLAKADGQREVSMVASGAVAAIVGAMQAHVGDPGVQEEACGAVASIVAQGGADRATVVASVSGVTAIINAIAAHPSVAGVQKYGCDALRALTEYSNANLPALPKAQTEPLLTAAKQQFPECSEAAEIVLSRMS